jgi:hypothetical protein
MKIFNWQLISTETYFLNLDLMLMQMHAVLGNSLIIIDTNKKHGPVHRDEWTPE